MSDSIEDPFSTRVQYPTLPEELTRLTRPITQAGMRQWARDLGMYLEALSAVGGFRLWEIDKTGHRAARPYDLNHAGEYVDSLEGIAVFLDYWERKRLDDEDRSRFSAAETREVLPWWKCPVSAWLSPMTCPVDPKLIARFPRPLTEPWVRAWARRHKFLLERLVGGGGYRLWDLRGKCTVGVPVDLTSDGEYVTSLEGIAQFLYCCD